MNVMVIAPHPDDEILGCGGTLAKHVQAGDKVAVVIVTKGAPDIFPSEVIDKTRVEMREAHRLLGVSQTFELDFPAPRTETVPIHLVSDALRKIVREFQADWVYLPHHGDLHHEHAVCYTAGLVSSRPTHSPVKKILVYEVLSETDWAPSRPDTTFIPSVFTDISEFLPKKLQAMSCFKSQLHPPPGPRTIEALTALATLRGSTIGVHAAEAFMLVRELN